jgi:hypothetical protein
VKQPQNNFNPNPENNRGGKSLNEWMVGGGMSGKGRSAVVDVVILSTGLSKCGICRYYLGWCSPLCFRGQRKYFDSVLLQRIVPTEPGAQG